MGEPSKKKVRTTVSLPETVYEEARSLVDREFGSCGSVNGLFVTAIVAYLKVLKRRQIDAQFAGMKNDAGFRKEVELLAEQFSQSDWEAFAAVERNN